jgi:hypothetical protein
MTQNEAYKTWWHNEGSGILPLPNEDMEEFAHRMTEIAWSNGAFKEHEEMLVAIDAIYDSEDPHPMYQEGYNHALDHIKQFIEGRQK